MARYRKPTMKETIALLTERARTENERAEKLWRALHGHLKGEIGKAAAAAVVNETVQCSCGRHASMWDGEHWKLCERCMST